MNVAGLN